MEISIDVFGLTDIGKKRTTNEDHFIAGEWTSGIRVASTNFNSTQNARLTGQAGLQILAVADGMGGHAAGALASSLVIDSFLEYLLNAADLPATAGSCQSDDTNLQDDLIAAAQQCQARLNDEVAAHPQHAGMGSTLTAACILWPCVFVVHVGDSRLYLFRNQQLEQLTTDHSLYELYVSRGDMTPEEAEEKGLQHRLHRVIAAGNEDLQPDFHRHELQPGDRLIVCSDGLTKHVDAQMIANIISSASTAEEACQSFIDAALQDGGTDNISVAVAITSDPDLANRETAEHFGIENIPSTQDNPRSDF